MKRNSTEESKMIARTIVGNVRYLCKNKNINIGTVEKECGVSAGYLSRLYNSESLVTLYTVVQLSKVLNVSIDDLIKRDFMKEQRIKELEAELRMLKGES